MIDSLVGVAMLVMLTGWMAGLVSVQYSLSSSRRSLSQAEQIEFLRAYASSACNQNIIATAKQDAVELLQGLLTAPGLIQRSEDDSLLVAKKEISQNGDLPYSEESQLEQLLRLSPRGEIGTFQFDNSAQDWTVWMRPKDDSSSDDPVKTRLFIC